MNSYESDIICIVKYLMNNFNYDLDSELTETNIVVYMLCENPSLIKNEIAMPIYMFLYIPKGKENIPNLQTIVFQIYIFLSKICDKQIVILNKDYYSSQVCFMKDISDIVFSISDSTNKTNSVDGIDDDVFVFDFKIKEEGIKSASNVYFLINDSTINKEIENISFDYHIFEQLLLQIDSGNHNFFINVKDQLTYSHFIKNLRNVLNSNKYSSFNEIKHQLESIDFYQMSSIYIFLKSSSNLMKDLNSAFIERCMEYILKTDENCNAIIKTVANELIQLLPIFDEKFHDKCLSMLKENEIDFELVFSSYLNFKFLEKQINQKKFLTDEQICNIIRSHEHFLEKEFKGIQLEDYNFLANLIKSERIALFEILKPFAEKNKIKNDIKEKNLKSLFKKGLNYIIRETEVLTEIDVIVDINKELEIEIPQDF